MSKKKQAAHAGTPAVTALDHAGIAHTLHPYEHDPSSTLGYGLEAAAAIGADPSAVFKTLMARIDGHLVVAVVPVTGSLDLKALAHAVGAKKAVMAEPADAERATGYVVGGIAPIGQRQPHSTVIDASARDQTTVYVSGGRRGLDIGLSPTDLANFTNAVIAPIARHTD